MGVYVTVYKSTLETKIPEENLQSYINAGWALLEEEQVEQPETYASYTKAQLFDIAKNRFIVVNSKENKNDIINKLLLADKQENKALSKPTNSGFTDNLIIE